MGGFSERRHHLLLEFVLDSNRNRRFGPTKVRATSGDAFSQGGHDVPIGELPALAELIIKAAENTQVWVESGFAAVPYSAADMRIRTSNS